MTDANGSPNDANVRRGDDRYPEPRTANVFGQWDRAGATWTANPNTYVADALRPPETDEEPMHPASRTAADDGSWLGCLVLLAVIVIAFTLGLVVSKAVQ